MRPDPAHGADPLPRVAAAGRASGSDPWFQVHPGEGPAVLLVHGMLSSRVQWQPNLAALSTLGRPVVVELLGHGRSPAPRERAAYHPERYVEAFERIRRSLGVERWLVVGQSLGAALTLRYALDHPERVAAHVLTNSNSAFAPEGWGERIRPVMEGLVRAVEQEGRAALERLPLHPRRGRALPALARDALVAEAELCDPLGVALTGAETSVNAPVGERLQANRVPSLLIAGGRERRFREHAERARERMPHLEYVELDAGHAVNLEAPGAFDRCALDFLGRHARSAKPC